MTASDKKAKASLASGTPSEPPAPTRKPRAKRSLTRPQIDVTFSQLHEEYLRHRRIEGIRDTTLRTYRTSLLPWAAWCAGQGITFVGQVLTRHAEDYLLSLQSRKLSERTIRNQAIVIKAALKYAFQQGYLASERLYGWKIPRMARASVYMPDHAEVGIILDAVAQHWSAANNPLSRFRNSAARSFFSRRDQAIIGVQVSTGLRISETFGLRLQDYSAEQKTLTVTQSKSGRPRAVPVSDYLAPILNVFVTDGFSDQYKQVLVTLYKIELTTDGTTYQTVFSDTAGQTINLSSLSSTKELLASLNAPAGTYTQARITFGDHFTLVTASGTSTSVAVDPTVGTAANGTVAITVATPTKLIAGQTSSLVIDFKLAEFQLVGSVLRPTVGAGDGSGNPGEGCIGHLDGTIGNLVAGTSFNLQNGNGHTIKVLISSATPIVSGQTGSAVTLANGQSVHVEGTFNPATQTVTATMVTLNDYTSTQHERATGTVASVSASAGSFVLTVNRADGIQPTSGTIAVQTSSATAFLKSGHSAGTIADVVAGATVDTSGTFDATTQTLTARSVFLH